MKQQLTAAFNYTIDLPHQWTRLVDSVAGFRPKLKPRVVATAIVAASVYIYLRRRLANSICRSRTLLHGKTVIITGANKGIGKETARELSRRGARVIMACRDVAKGEEAAKEIEITSRGEVVVRHLDLSSFTSIRKFADEIIRTEERVDILINNAGVLCVKEKTKDGLDMQFVTNYLGPFLLTMLLLEKLKASAPARIINTSSVLHHNGKMNWEDLNMNKRPNFYKPVVAYAHSKLAVILFTRELASKLSGSRVNVYCVDPGWVQSSQTGHCFGNYTSSLSRAALSLLSFFLPIVLSAREAAQTTIFCALEKKLERQNGLYYKDCDSEKPSDRALDNLDKKTLWDISMKMAGLQE